jgi:hypothetical protein
MNTQDWFTQWDQALKFLHKQFRWWGGGFRQFLGCLQTLHKSGVVDLEPFVIRLVAEIDNLGNHWNIKMPSNIGAQAGGRIRYYFDHDGTPLR